MLFELKYDGNSMSYIYKDGKLFQCLTRGDGKLALNRPKMKLLVPNTIPIDGVVEIRGEVLIEKKLFRENMQILTKFRMREMLLLDIFPQKIWISKLLMI